MTVEARTKRGVIRRGDLVLTEKWQAVEARSLGALAGQPNVEVRETADKPAPEEAAPAADGPAEGAPEEGAEAGEDGGAEEEAETAADGASEAFERPTRKSSGKRGRR